MDEIENQKQQSLGQFIKSQFHRKLTQLLLSVSVFSLFFSHSYWLSLLHSFNFNFNNSLPNFQLFSYTIDTKYCIFLLCNGLLIFLSKNSGLISSSSKYNVSDDQSFKSYEEEDAQKWGLMTTVEEEENLGFFEEVVKGSDDELFVQEFGESENYDIEEEDEVELVEGNRVLSTEELNKRFDEFIRKMKEELRIEARQELDMI